MLLEEASIGSKPIRKFFQKIDIIIKRWLQKNDFVVAFFISYRS